MLHDLLAAFSGRGSNGITFVGSKSFTHFNNTGTACSLTDLKDTAGNNATLAENDYVVVLYVGSSTGISAPSGASVTPSGYTALHVREFGNDDYETTLTTSGKFMGTTPDSSVTIPAVTQVGGGVACCIFAFRGVNLSVQMDVTAQTGNGTNGGVPDAPAITPSTAGAWIIAVGGAANIAGSNAALTRPPNLSSLTNHFRGVLATVGAYDAMAGFGIYTGWVSGSFNPDPFGGGTSAAEASRAMATMVLRPA